MTTRTRTPLEDFHNRLRILSSIDANELEASLGRNNEWVSFRGSPSRWFIRASDEDAAKVWAVLERRSR